MCVGCNVQSSSGHPSVRLGSVRLRAFWGKWYNFIPPAWRLWDLCLKSKYRPGQNQYGRSRGEGHPAPWIMVWKEGAWGFEVGLQRSRPWFHPELTRPTPYNRGVRQFMWGCFIIAWRSNSVDEQLQVC